MRLPEPPPSLNDLFSDCAAGLSAALADPRYVALCRRVEAGYRPWRQVKYLAAAEGLSPHILWCMVKMARASTYRTLPLRGASGVPLKFTCPDPVQEELMHVDQQLAGRLIASDEQPISHAQQERFVISALREEAIASSMLEGAATTRRDAKKMLASGRRPRTRGEQMVLNNYQAISFIREQRSTPLTPELLLHVQELLTRSTLDREDECGRLRTDEDRVTITDAYENVIHEPPPAAELPARLNALCDFANGHTGEGFIHPVIRASVLHFQLGFDHPFCDGNGRTARAIFYWSMLRAGYWLFSYLPISRLIYAGPSKYAMAYLHAEADEFDVTYFLMYKARIIGRARRDLNQYIASKQQEMAAARRLFEADYRLNHRQRDVVLRMVRSPHASVTVKEHESRHNAAYGSARNDLLKLLEWGYLSRVQVGNRFEYVRGPKLDAAE